MKRVKCSYLGCSGRRVHHEHPNIPRPHQEFDVPNEHPGPWYCSIECWVYAKAEKEQKDGMPNPTL